MAKLKINVGLALFKRTQYWIAYCPALKLYGYSDQSEEEALKDFDKAVETFVEVHTQLNSLNEVLLNLGWTRRDHMFDSPKYFNIPVEQLRNGITSRQNRDVMIPVC